MIESGSVVVDLNLNGEEELGVDWEPSLHMRHSPAEEVRSVLVEVRIGEERVASPATTVTAGTP